MTPPLAPPNGTPTTAHFHVIQAASALTSSRWTSGANRIPPFDGPSTSLWITRYPSNTLSDPLSMTTGTLVMWMRDGLRRYS